VNTPTTTTASVSSLLANLQPREIVDSALTTTQAEFLDLFGNTPILLVRLGSADSELAAGLLATVRTHEGVAATPIVEPMSFETERSGTTFRSGDTNPPAQEEPERLARLMESEPLFGAPLRKRAGVDVAFNDRISVGRTVNKDIVLRHITVSKFHGWFEVDAEGGAYFTEAGSKNGTRINGKILSPREQVALHLGDTIRFGSVDVLSCSPAALWKAVHICGKR
jgi:hypothetical protein